MISRTGGGQMSRNVMTGGSQMGTRVRNQTSMGFQESRGFQQAARATGEFGGSRGSYVS